MAKRKVHDISAETDMTPMIDMTFQLIAFFMVLLNFEEGNQSERIKLPASELAKPPEGPSESPLTLQLTKDGVVLFNGDEVPVVDMKPLLLREAQMLVRSKRAAADAQVIIRADGGTPTGKVQELIKLCQENRFEKFSLRASARNGRRPRGEHAMKLRPRSTVDKVEQQMTPMIDVVFQLLAFFLFSFKIAAQEGDFNVKMPLAGAAATIEDTLPPIQVRLVANADGTLNRIQLGDRNLHQSFAALHQEVMSIVGGNPQAAEKTEVELDCDYGLHYDNVISAITAVSGHMDSAGHVVKLIEKIKFAPPRLPK